jgi:hypothetical protein
LKLVRENTHCCVEHWEELPFWADFLCPNISIVPAFALAEAVYFVFTQWVCRCLRKPHDMAFIYSVRLIPIFSLINQPSDDLLLSSAHTVSCIYDCFHLGLFNVFLRFSIIQPNSLKPLLLNINTITIHKECLTSLVQVLTEFRIYSHLYMG